MGCHSRRSSSGSRCREQAAGYGQRRVAGDPGVYSAAAGARSPPAGGSTARVEAAAGEQLLMPAALGDAPVVQDDDLVGVDDGREPVRDDERRASGGDALAGRPAAPARCGCPGHSSPRRGSGCGGSFRSTRAIATRCFSPPESFEPALADLGVVAVGQARDEVVDLGDCAAASTSAWARSRAAIGDVGADRVVEQHGVLRHDADGAAQAVLGDGAHDPAPSIVIAPEVTS